jgi:hypothetical protein
MTGNSVTGVGNSMSEPKRQFQWFEASLVMGAMRSLGGCSAHADRR